MDPDYHRAIFDAEYAALDRRRINESWEDATLEAEWPKVFVRLKGNARRAGSEYLARIDTKPYPVRPYALGFLPPDLPRDRWASAFGRDPRNWPFSPLAGLQGSFHVAFSGPYPVFWCRPCTLEYFYYHATDYWEPAAWPLSRVVAHLREAASQAEHPSEWRRVQRDALVAHAKARGIELAPTAGVGDE